MHLNVAKLFPLILPGAGYPGQAIDGRGASGGLNIRGQNDRFPIAGLESLDDGSYANGDYSAIPGVPGEDYPIYSIIPQTDFDCKQQQWPGYYADVFTKCQVFHVCAQNRTFDFLCPNGTIFSQENLVCVWWNQFDCDSAPSLYENNANIYDYSQNGQNSIGGRPGNIVDQQNQFGSRTPVAPGGINFRPTNGPTNGPDYINPISSSGFPTRLSSPASNTHGPGHYNPSSPQYPSHSSSHSLNGIHSTIPTSTGSHSIVGGIPPGGVSGYVPPIPIQSTPSTGYPISRIPTPGDLVTPGFSPSGIPSTGYQQNIPQNNENKISREYLPVQ